MVTLAKKKNRKKRNEKKNDNNFCRWECINKADRKVSQPKKEALKTTNTYSYSYKNHSFIHSARQNTKTKKKQQNERTKNSIRRESFYKVKNNLKATKVV